MVNFTLGRSIKSKCDKMLIAAKASQLVDLLNNEEQILRDVIKKQTTEDKFVEYNLGTYKLYAIVVKGKMNSADWQELGGAAWKKVKKCREVKVYICDVDEQCYYDFSLGMEMSSYSFDKYFTKKPSSFYPKLEQIVYVGSGLQNFDGYKSYAGLANCIRYARDLVNEPANALTPQIMADDIKRLEYLGLEVDVLQEDQMKELGFNLALAVAQGSANRPRIAVIKWRGCKEHQDFTVGLVGKGVTFDSGGISIKPAAGMGDMKQDMAGAAAMTAVMKSLALQNVKQNVVAVVGLVENMPSGSAYRPGDVFTSMSGQTVEVINTDAEGRLVLADCLTYIQRNFHPKYVIDMATLTGAIIIALGNTYAGMFSNSKKLATVLESSGENSGEAVWKMPMHEDYNKMMDSTIADMKNTGGRGAGSATAACFLKRFVEEGTQWAHIDIAGMDMSDGSKTLYPKGASGFGVKLINQFIRQIAQ